MDGRSQHASAAFVSTVSSVSTGCAISRRGERLCRALGEALRAVEFVNPVDGRLSAWPVAVDIICGQPVRTVDWHPPSFCVNSDTDRVARPVDGVPIVSLKVGWGGVQAVVAARFFADVEQSGRRSWRGRANRRQK